MKEFQEKIQKQFTSMCESGKLFRANVTGQSVWEHNYCRLKKTLYLGIQTALNITVITVKTLLEGMVMLYLLMTSLKL